MLKIVYIFLAGFFGLFARYFTALALTPFALLVGLGCFLAGVAMILLIPGGILLMIFGGHDQFPMGLHVFFLGCEWLAYGFASGLLAFFIKWAWQRVGQGLTHVTTHPPRWIAR